MTYEVVIRKDHPVKEGTLSAYHFGDMSQPIRLIMLHATGFNGRSYRTLLEAQNIHCVSLDLRGHGLTTLPADPSQLNNYHPLRDDVLDFIRRYCEAGIVVAGHSMGASVGMLLAPFLKDQLKGYVGFDSPLMPPWMSPLLSIPGFTDSLKRRLPIAVAAGRRRAVFDSYDQVFQRYQNRSVFKGFSDEVLHDYIQGGFVEEGGQVKLACHPKWEQAIFGAQGHNLYKAARSLPKENTRLLFAKVNAPSSPLSRERMRGIVGAKNVKRYKDFNHMFPLNEVIFTRQVLSDVLGRAEFGT